MLNIISQDVLNIIFSYLDYDVLKIPLLSQYFKKYFDNNNNYICNKLFQNKSKSMNFKHCYIIYKSLIYYDIGLTYVWDDSDNEIIQKYLFDSVGYLLTNDIEDDISIAISIIDNILKEYPNKNSLILFELMEFLLNDYSGSIDKKIKVLDILVNQYHIDMHEFEPHYDDYLNSFSGMSTEVLWHLVINDYVDLGKCYQMRDLLIDRFFPDDKRIFALRYKCHIDNILDHVYDLDEFILSLIDDSDGETLSYIVANFGLDLDEPLYYEALTHSENHSLIWKLTNI